MGCNTPVTMIVYNKDIIITGGATMFKKYMFALLILVLLVSQFVVLAEDVSEEPYVYIISPKVGDSGKTILNETLFISIYIQSEASLNLELVKKPVYDFEVVTEDLPEAVDFFIEEKVLFSETQASKNVFTKKEIIKAYEETSKHLDELKENYRIKRKNLGEISQNTENVSSLSSSERLRLQSFEKAKSNLNKGMVAYNFWKEAYLELFDKVIFSNVKMSVDASFPYFEYTLDNVQPGYYKLAIKNLDGKIVESLEFEVVTEQSIANEIINSSDFFKEMLQKNVFE
jgi:hypothetical protein